MSAMDAARRIGDRPERQGRTWTFIGVAAICGFVLLAAVVVGSEVGPSHYDLGGGYYLSISTSTYVTLIKRGSGVLGYVSPKVILPLMLVSGVTGVAWVLRARRGRSSGCRGF